LGLLLERYNIRYNRGKAPPFHFETMLNSCEHSSLVAACFTRMKAEQQFSGTLRAGMLR